MTIFIKLYYYTIKNDKIICAFSCLVPAWDPVDPPAQHAGGGGGFWLQLPDLQLSQTQVDNYMLSPADLSSVLRIRIWDPVPFWAWTRDSGWKNLNPDPGSGMNILDNLSGSLETVFWVKNT